MRPGRTSWWPCDAAEHDRELTVELGEEFGPAAHAVTRILKDLAQQQRDGGRVRTGFRVIASKCHLAVGSDAASARALAREIVERAGEIGWLDDLHVDDDGRRFVARISGWEADSARGRESIKKATQRAAAKTTDVPPAGDTPPGQSQPEGTTPCDVPETGDESGSVPPNRSDQREPDLRAAAARPRAAAEVDAALAVIGGRRGLCVPTMSEVDEVLALFPDRDVARALAELRRWAQRESPKNLLGALRRVLEDAPQLPPSARPVAIEPATDDDRAVWEGARERLRARIDPGLFATWIEPLHLAGRVGGALALGAPREVVAWIEARATTALRQAVDGREIRIIELDQEAQAA